MRFDGKHVLVTGASRGIGRAVAEAFGSAGARLTILADDPVITQAAQEIARVSAAQVAPVQCDIADRTAVQAALSELDTIDVLVNNAGLERLTPIRTSGLAVLDTYARIIDINVNGSFWVTHAALPHMKRGGRIIFTASIWGKSVEAEFAAYCASKHAVIGLMRVLAKELGPDGISVNAVCPGWVRTEASMRSLHIMAERSGRPEPELLDEIVGGQAMDGLMEPKDIVGPYLFLASDAAANITGQALNIDRGEVMI
ncbi:SDR family NAD(P)-dependent oxidoreductase [Dongia deserti]|uniref:SDR family NAD(P)-dependent oxidoreductase n=1 Tax=Dongia deserti TaxID=2268030 RepID=UPI000E65ADB3|nr:SDR family oxidoreductase [Dongia deserti]